MKVKTNLKPAHEKPSDSDSELLKENRSEELKQVRVRTE